MIIDPRGMSVIEWTDRVNGLLSPYGATPRLDDLDEWKEWAYGILRVPNIADWGIPSPLYYTSWVAWADDFNKVLPQQVQ